MARSLNKALLIGNLGSDPEIRTTADGTKVAGLSVATNRNWTDRNGEAQERTEWHRVIAWTNLAEIAEQFLSRGDRVYIEGEIQYRSYEDRDGATRYVTEIRARELVMLGGREGAAPAAPSVADDASPEPVAAGRLGSEASGIPDDDLPF
ncbi:MAG: single-stranded DNA-binding protein [Dehalococcoidia bacterium]